MVSKKDIEMVDPAKDHEAKQSKAAKKQNAPSPSYPVDNTTGEYRQDLAEQPSMGTEAASEEHPTVAEAKQAEDDD